MVPLLTYIESLRADHLAVHTRADRTRENTETQLRLRLDEMNGFRAALKDQADTLLPRAQFEVHRERIDDRLGKIEAAVVRMESRQNLYGVLIAAAVIVLVILVLVAR